MRRIAHQCFQAREKAMLFKLERVQTTRVPDHCICANEYRPKHGNELGLARIGYLDQATMPPPTLEWFD